jgi:hypothetical protein
MAFGHGFTRKQVIFARHRLNSDRKDYRDKAFGKPFVLSSHSHQRVC